MAEDVAQGLSRPRSRKALPWRKDPAILERMATVEQHCFARLSNRTIAELVGVDEITVRRDLARLQELWLERAGEKQDLHRARMVAKLQEAQRLSLAAASFDLAAERAVLFGEDAEGKPVQVQRDAKGGAQFRGQKAAALNVYRQAVMDEAHVLGVAVPDDVPAQAMQVVIIGIAAQDL